jgi:acetyl-CoA carboxylase carboxyltransferase component
MGERAELLYRIVWPYVQEIISQVLEEKADLREATAESLAEIVCGKARVHGQEHG